ncbi:CPBP family intramembrane glutamic endopeptidase [uncultured Lactobacillus sp.]|uniref:CPBP family intramembrane glutamic endopeptidase n=1 Tax=uncultured Lactobacillus sp. TaxID=153152 RepID=UPI00260D6CEB|nr:CPBP family intramembrane glutamic endopeptidase [uncultured Lactobacillus sp.]
MKTLENIFKWIGIAIWLFLIFAFMQVPAIESTPVYSIDSQRQFIEAFKQVNLPHNIFMMVTFTIITFIMEWFACIWLKNKLVFSIKVTKKSVILALAAGLFSFIIEILTMFSAFTNNSKPSVFIETLKTWMAVPLILDLVLIGPILEELLFQAGIQKGVFRKLNPWVAIILTSIIFAAAHDVTLNVAFFHRVLAGVAFGYVYQKTGDIKMAILGHSMSNLLPLIVCCAEAWS